MKHRLSTVLAVLLGAGACAGDAPTATVPVFDVSASMGIVANGGRNAATSLSGAEEVPPTATRARGTAIFHLSDDGLELSYKLIVANIENVVQAHIHLNPAGQNGPVVAFLFGPAAAGGGRVNGVIAEGVITADDLISSLAGQPLSALVDAMVAGNTYVNVHTNDGVGSSNTGPGDFASGEIRGQID